MMQSATLCVMVWLGLVARPLADPVHPEPSSTNRVLIIDRCSTSVSGARATLIIGPLKRTGNIYEGDYQMKVSPYFFKGEKGKLAIIVSDESIAKVDKGLATDVIGTATTNGEKGKARHIDATATPIDHDRGSLKLSFMADETKMVFDTAYRLVDP